MLNKDEIDRVVSLGYVYDHDYLYYSLILGEPFLVDDRLCYFDGQILFVNGFSLGGDNRLPNLTGVLESNGCFNRAEYVWYWGPKPISGERMEGFDMLDISEPSHLNVDRMINLSEFSLSDLPKARYDLNKATKDGLTATIKTQQPLCSYHLDTIANFAVQSKVSLSHVSFLTAVRYYALSPTAAVHEAWRGDEFCGFSVVSHTLANRHISLQLFTVPGVKGVSAILYNSQLEDAKAAGVRYFNLGYAAGSQGLHDYKLKWGAHESNPPYYETVYYRKGVAPPAPSERFMLWPERTSSTRLLKPREGDNKKQDTDSAAE